MRAFLTQLAVPPKATKQHISSFNMTSQATHYSSTVWLPSRLMTQVIDGSEHKDRIDTTSVENIQTELAWFQGVLDPRSSTPDIENKPYATSLIFQPLLQVTSVIKACP